MIDTFLCLGCGNRLAAPDNLAPGAKVKCPSCGLQFNLPETENVSGRESRVLPYEDQGGDQLGPHLLKEVPTDYVIDLDTWLRHCAGPLECSPWVDDSVHGDRRAHYLAHFRRG